MKVKDFQYGYPGTSLIIGAHLSGIMEIYKKGKTEPIAVIEVDAVPGAGADKEFRRDMAYKELADNLIRLIKKWVPRAGGGDFNGKLVVYRGGAFGIICRR